MALISSSAGSTASAPGAAAPSAIGGSPAPAGTADAANPFMQLLNGMAGASTPAAAAPSPQDLSALADVLDTADMLPGEDLELDETDEDDTDALALASLLPGLSLLAPLAHGTGVGSGTAGTVATAIAASMGAGSAQSTIEALLAEAGAAASDGSGAEAGDGVDAQLTTSHIQTLLSAQAARTADSAPEAVLRSPVGTPAWNDELGAQLTWMAANGREAASLRLSPEHLGPLEIRISVRDGEASVWFGASNPDTRSALEQSLPRLRELFAAQGLVLADAGVSRESPRDAFRPAGTGSSAGMHDASDAGGETSVTSITSPRLGLIDTYV